MFPEQVENDHLALQTCWLIIICVKQIDLQMSYFGTLFQASLQEQAAGDRPRRTPWFMMLAGLALLESWRIGKAWRRAVSARAVWLRCTCSFAWPIILSRLSGWEKKENPVTFVTMQRESFTANCVTYSYVSPAFREAISAAAA